MATWQSRWAGPPLAAPPILLAGTAAGNYLNDVDPGSRKVEGQAGNVSLSATSDISKAFMVGGIDNDNEWRIAA